MLRINEFKVENLSSGCVTDNPAPVFSFFHDKFREKCSAEKSSVVCE